MGSAQADTIDLQFRSGERIRISGPGQGEQGYFMAPNSTGLLSDAPVKTIWHKTLFGQAFSGMEWMRREVVATINIGYDEQIDPERDPDEWHDLYSALREKFAYDEDTKVIYGSPDGDRLLYARMIETPKPFSTQSFEGKDPKLWSFGSVVLTMACELPFYLGPTEVYEWEVEGTGDSWTRLPFYNSSDVPIWPEFEVTGGARFQLPDFSWGNEYYGRGLADTDKTILTPLLRADEACTIHTRPDEETYQSFNDAPVGLRTNGQDFEYPIPPGRGVGMSTLDGQNDPGAVIRALDMTDGAAVRVKLPRWYSSPFARPRLVRAA